MFAYVPAALAPGSALVVVLHGCTQTAAGYDLGAGWSTLADRYGIVVVFPEQQSANNPNRCFNWFLPGDTNRSRRGALDSSDGCALSPITTRRHGSSARACRRGGAMTSVMLATYPDVFAAGAHYCRPPLWRRRQRSAGVRKHVPEPATPGAGVGRLGSGCSATFRAVAARFGLAWRQ